jgi:CarD family transcriptional regulator, regulator of rRNA transcription
MKVSAGTAAKGRGAAASRYAAPRRASPTPAKAAQTVAAKKTAAAAEPVRPARNKAVIKPAAAKASAMAKPAAPKPATGKPDIRPVQAEPAVSTAPRPPAATAPAAPPQAVQPRPPVAPPRPGFPATVPSQAERRPNMPDRLPPRPPAKAETFVEGDHVVYPTHGVGKVERIATEEIAGHKLELIHITFEENRMTLRVPVAKARSAGLRKLATRKLFDEALAVLKGRARIKRTMWSRRAQEYEAKINSGDPLAIAEVVRDLHRNAGQPDQSFSERQIYEAAMDRLAAELAALDKTDKLTAATKLTNFLKTV